MWSVGLEWIVYFWPFGTIKFIVKRIIFATHPFRFCASVGSQNANFDRWTSWGGVPGNHLNLNWRPEKWRMKYESNVEKWSCPSQKMDTFNFTVSEHSFSPFLYFEVFIFILVLWSTVYWRVYLPLGLRWLFVRNNRSQNALWGVCARSHRPMPWHSPLCVSSAALRNGIDILYSRSSKLSIQSGVS